LEVVMRSESLGQRLQRLGQDFFFWGGGL